MPAMSARRRRSAWLASCSKRDEEPTDVFQTGLAPFVLLAQEGSGRKRIAVDGLFGLIADFEQREHAFGRKTYNARSETVPGGPAP